MDKVMSKLTVFFENPFWVGIFEKIEDENIFASKIIFGKEPKDSEIYEFIIKNYYNLSFSPARAIDIKETRKNPKRMQREASKQLKEIKISTKSQQALKEQNELFKIIRKKKSKEEKEAEIKRAFELKQQKKKKKLKGR